MGIRLNDDPKNYRRNEGRNLTWTGSLGPVTLKDMQQEFERRMAIRDRHRPLDMSSLDHEFAEMHRPPARTFLDWATFGAIPWLRRIEARLTA